MSTGVAPPASADTLLMSRQPLRAQHAAVALLLLADGRYVLQLRDPKPDIFYPDHWGCFGGAVDEGETALDAVTRELREEIGIEVRPSDCAYFTEFTFDFGFVGDGIAYRRYFTVRLPQQTLDGMSLNEGAAVDAFAPEEALSRLRLVPYDAFALWLYANSTRLRFAGSVADLSASRQA